MKGCASQGTGDNFQALLLGHRPEKDPDPQSTWYLEIGYNLKKDPQGPHTFCHFLWSVTALK